METNEKKSAINLTVIKLGLVSLFADISSEMLYPITPIFLTTILGASMASVGLIEGVAEAIASLLKTYSGVWSDRLMKRKPFIITGYFLSAVSKPLTGVAGSWIHVLIARSLDRTGKGLRGAPRDALLAESVDDSLRGAAFGWHRAMDTLGAAIGPVLAFVYLAYFNDDLRSIYLLAVVPGLISVFIVLSLIEKTNSDKKETKLIPINFSWKGFSKDYKIYLISWGLFSLTNSSDVFLIMKAKEQGMSITTVIFMYCFYNLVYSMMSPYFGKLSDSIPRKKVMISGLLIFSLVYCGFSIAVSGWHFWLLFGVYGLYMAATEGVGKAMAVDFVGPNQKASGLGFLATLTGFSTIFASTVAGEIWDHFGSSWTFIYGVTGAVLCIIILTQIQSKSQPALNI